MRCLYLLFVAGFVLLVGCGRTSESPRMATATVDGRAQQDAAAGGKEEAGREPAQARDEAAIPRKLIYNAQVTLTVESFDKAEPQVAHLVHDVKGYVAKSEVSGSPGSPRTGSWTIRVPVAKFDEFMDAIAKLGELQRRKTDSEDITDRYFDLQARLKNKQEQENRLREHLKKSTGNLKEILEVEEQLNRVRGEIEVQQGQLQRWDKLVELATVTLTVYERKDYVPATSPTFSTSIGRTFSGSVHLLVEVGKGLCLVVVALVPWLPVLAVPVLAIWIFARRLRHIPGRPALASESSVSSPPSEPTAPA